MSLILLSILFLFGCTVPEPVVEETEKSVEAINEEFVISGIENGECVVRTINLWSTQSMSSKSGSVEKVCGGIKVTAFEKVESSSLNRVLYHIKTPDGQSGWITDSFVNKNGICQADNDCKSIGNYFAYEEDVLGEKKEVFEMVPGTCLEGICVACIETRDCSGSAVCDITKNKCVECLSNKDCDTSSNRITDKLTCDTVNNECVECLTDNDCPSSDDSWDKDKKICKLGKFTPVLNECVECRDNYGCPEDEYCSHSGSCDKR